MKKSLSVTVITGNEEHNIKECLESVKWADEIIVVDSESNDKTRDIAAEYTDKVFIKPWEGFAPQKQFALDQATGNWILSIDADERVTEALQQDIETILQTETDYDGYYIPRKSYLWNYWVRTCGWYPGYQLRLMKNGKVKVAFRKVHEGFIVEGKRGHLKGDILHLTNQTIKETFDKINTYSSLEAEERKDRKKVTPLDIILHPIIAFINYYIGKKGFRDGVYGLIVSLQHSVTNLLTYMKIYELQKHSKNQTTD